MRQPYAVVFAGVPGSSKTIVANYLSVKFNLPVFNNDQLRFEVREDLMVDDINIPRALAEFEKRYKQRHLELLATGNSMILDGSVDRRWAEHKKQLQDAGYVWYMIDMCLSEEFLTKLFTATGRANFLTRLPGYLEQHEQFMQKYSNDVRLRITDDEFPDRLELSAEGLQAFLDTLEKQLLKR
jgi:hypothetical protein